MKLYRDSFGDRFTLGPSTGRRKQRIGLRRMYLRIVEPDTQELSLTADQCRNLAHDLLNAALDLEEVSK